jgi:hypothetical protein
MSNTETTTGNTIPVVIDGRNYTIHTDQMGTTCLSHVYRITGTRKADGALCIHHTGEYKGRAVAVGISHLAGLNWWDFREVVELLGEEAA